MNAGSVVGEWAGKDRGLFDPALRFYGKCAVLPPDQRRVKEPQIVVSGSAKFSMEVFISRAIEESPVHSSIGSRSDSAYLPAHDIAGSRAVGAVLLVKRRPSLVH